MRISMTLSSGVCVTENTIFYFTSGGAEQPRPPRSVTDALLESLGLQFTIPFGNCLSFQTWNSLVIPPLLPLPSYVQQVGTQSMVCQPQKASSSFSLVSLSHLLCLSFLQKLPEWCYTRPSSLVCYILSVFQISSFLKGLA